MGLNPREMHDQLLANKVDGARHDVDLCPFCSGREAAAEQAQPPASVPSGTTPSGASTSATTPTTEGGTQDMTAPATDKTMAVETHEALQAKAVADAVSTTEKALETKTAEATTAQARVAELEGELNSVKEDNARINKDLDKAQLELKGATDEVAALKQAETDREEASRLAEATTKRVDQVKALEVFPEEYVQEKSSSWASLSEDDWAARIDEWTKLKPASAGKGKEGSDTASAMTGTTGTTTTDPASDAASETKPPARRAVLGLT